MTRILFITATRVGDAVLSTGVLAELLKQYPKARVTVACGESASGLFCHIPHLERIISLTKRRYNLHWFTLWKTCFPYSWDITVDLRGSPITWFMWSKKRYIKHGGRSRGHRLHHLAKVFSFSPAPLPTVWLSEDDKKRAATIIPTGQQIIAFGPTANWQGKIWPTNRYALLWQHLTTAYPNAIPALFYGPGTQEALLVRPVLADLPQAIDAGGRFTLTQTAAMLARCCLYIGNDSGLMHLAAATGIPTLGLFGPSCPSQYAPTGALSRWVSPSSQKTDQEKTPIEEGKASMTDISVNCVAKAALALLDQAKHDHSHQTIML